MLPVRHFLVRTILSLQALHVDQSLITGGACIGTNMPLCEHSIFLDAAAVSDQLEEFFDFSAQLVQFSCGLLFGRTRIPYQLSLIGELLLEKCLELLQLALVSFSG